MSSTSSVAVKELPLFPLPEIVLFPETPLPLHIFEPRYRLMVNTILEGDRAFGVLLWDPSTGQPVSVGCSAQISEVKRLPDGRMNLMTHGHKRFRVIEYTQKQPYLVALVEWIDDFPSKRNLQALAGEVTGLLREVIRLSSKLTEAPLDLPENMPETPVELSYWVASNLYGVATEQQTLLEMRDTAKRLSGQASILHGTVKYLAARTAIKEAFKV